jgi:hypothetical protein
MEVEVEMWSMYPALRNKGGLALEAEISELELVLALP